MRVLPPAARLYVLLVTLAALACLAPAARGRVEGDWAKVLALAALYAVCEQITRCPLMGRHAPKGMGSFFPVLLAGALMMQPAAAALVPVPGALARRVEQRPRWVRRVWHAAQLSVATSCASYAYRAVDGPRTLAALDLPRGLLPAGLTALVFCLVSGVLVGGVLMTAERCTVRVALRGVLLASLAPHLAYGIVGLMMAMLWQGPYGAFAAALTLLPMYVSCWVFAQYHREWAAHQATVRALVQAVDLKDEYTRGHSERVARASVMIGREIGLAEARVDALRFAGVLHDVGKLGVPTRLLRKCGPLTPEERRVIELHPEYGHEMVRGIGFLDEARSAILHHHERLDGRGYPYGLAGDQIPQFARVVAVADAFDAMTSTRSYRPAKPVSDAVEELRRCAGTQFDAEMVGALLRAIGRQGWDLAVAAAQDSARPAPAGQPDTSQPDTDTSPAGTSHAAAGQADVVRADGGRAGEGQGPDAGPAAAGGPAALRGRP